MTKPIASQVFTDAIQRRKTDHPFDRISADMGYRLKKIPENIAPGLGCIAVPAIEALIVEGVAPGPPEQSTRSIQRTIKDLLDRCNAAQSATARSIRYEYAALKVGTSRLEALCRDSEKLGTLAVQVCEQHGRQ